MNKRRGGGVGVRLCFSPDRIFRVGHVRCTFFARLAAPRVEGCETEPTPANKPHLVSLPAQFDLLISTLEWRLSILNHRRVRSSTKNF